MSLIEYIQNNPKLIVETTGSSYQISLEKKDKKSSD
jgi:hypothetical protein